jgi:hypothetical protein
VTPATDVRACSAVRVRRLAAGELEGAERDLAEQHVRDCARCQAMLREIDAERARLARDVPFEAFASGVAEKLARPAPRVLRMSRLVPLAAAAALLLVVSSQITHSGSEIRSKGGASVALFQRQGASAIALDAEGRTAGAGPIALQIAGGPYAAAVLLERSDATLLYAGESKLALQHPFVWTGPEHSAKVVVVVSNRPLDGEAVRAAIARDRAAAEIPGAEIIVRPLERRAP